MTDTHIAAIRAREQAATKGPWWQRSWRQPEAPCANAVELSDLLCYLPDEGVPRFWRWDADGEFAAHAREDIPYLLAALDAATAERDRWQGTARVLEMAEMDRRAERDAALARAEESNRKRFEREVAKEMGFTCRKAEEGRG